MNDDLKTLEALGFEEPTKVGSQLQCICPICGKRKAYINPERGVWDCKLCSESGNAISAITILFNKVFRPAMTYTDYGVIRAARARKPGPSLPQEAFELDHLLGKMNDGKYCWIVNKPDGTAFGMRVWDPRPHGQKNHAVHALAGRKLAVMGMEQLSDDSKKDEPVYICEGEWDRISWQWVLHENDEPGIVLCVPGAGHAFKEESEFFRGRNVIGLYDNDKAGKQGTVKAFKALKQKVASLKFIHWDEKKEDGYDVDDLVKSFLKDTFQAYEYIKAHLSDKPTGESESAASGLLAQSVDREAQQADLEPIGVQKLHDVFSKWLKLDNYDLLDISIAACLSIYLPGNPLWLFVVAPPSGSKSETIMPLSEWWRVHALSNLTSASLISGYPTGNTDPSLFASLQGKKAVLAIKDLTPLLQSGQEQRDEVFGILRDAYDGQITKIFGNGLSRSYRDLHFTVIAGVTPAIDVISHTSLGERFLKFRADRDTDRADDIERAQRAIANCGNEDDMRKELREAAVRSLIREYDLARIPRPSDKLSHSISELAYAVANLRGVAPTDKGTDTQFMPPMSEAPPRLATQFVKLAQALAMHYESDTLEHAQIMRIVRRTALHTPDTVSMKVAQALYHTQNEPHSTLSLSRLINGISRETVTKVLTKFFRLGIVRMETGQDRNATTWSYSEEFYDLLKRVQLFDDLPPSDVFYSAKFLPKKPMIIKRVKK